MKGIRAIPQILSSLSCSFSPFLKRKWKRHRWSMVYLDHNMFTPLVSTLHIQSSFPIRSMLFVFPFWTNLLHSFIRWLTLSSMSPHRWHLIFCYILYITTFIYIVLLHLLQLLIIKIQFTQSCLKPVLIISSLIIILMTITTKENRENYGLCCPGWLRNKTEGKWKER